MALQRLPNRGGIPMFPLPGYPNNLNTSGATISIIDAVGESTGLIGRVLFAGGPGTSKTFSSSGAKIHYRTGTVVFASGSTTMRIGVQDVGSTGVEDGVWTGEPQVDIVGGGGGIASNAVNVATIASGSRTLTHGDLIAVVFEMTAKGGSDAVRIAAHAPSTAGFPYVTTDTGSGPSKPGTSAMPGVILESDDGTLASFGEQSVLTSSEPDIAYHLDTATADEYGLMFQVPFRCFVNGIIGFFGDLDPGEDCELILYSDPLGTPTVMAKHDLDGDLYCSPSTNLGIGHFRITEQTLEPNTNYAVTLRPTTADTDRLLRRYSMPIDARSLLCFGTTMREIQRVDNSGAFSQNAVTQFPALGIMVSGFDDGVSSGSGYSRGRVVNG